MKRHTVVTLGAMLFLFSLVFFGCIDRPMTMIDDARQALQDARQAGAGDYAPEILRHAEDIFEKAQEELGIQDQQFLFFRNYENLQGILRTVATEGRRAKIQAVVNKEKVKVEAQVAVSMAKSKLDEAQMILSEALIGNGTHAVLQALTGELHIAASMFSDLQVAIGREDFGGARAKAHAIQSLATRVHDDVAHAMHKTGKTKV